jgi:hypothetical protein
MRSESQAWELIDTQDCIVRDPFSGDHSQGPSE